MTSFLRFQVGSYSFVLPATRVMAIEAATSEDALHRSWRGRALPLLDLTRHVGGRAGSVRHDLVLEDDEPGIAACIVRVDEVNGLLELHGGDERPLPAVADDTDALIEGICIERNGAQKTMLYRLRVPREAFAREAYHDE